MLVRKPPQFRNTLTKRGIFLFGKKLSLLIVTPTGTHVGSKRLSMYDFILITSIEIVESKFLKLEYLRSKSTTADQPQSGPMREQHQILGIIMRIEMHQ